MPSNIFLLDDKKKPRVIPWFTNKIDFQNFISSRSPPYWSTGVPERRNVKNYIDWIFKFSFFEKVDRHSKRIRLNREVRLPPISRVAGTRKCTCFNTSIYGKRITFSNSIHRLRYSPLVIEFTFFIELRTSTQQYISDCVRFYSW